MRRGNDGGTDDVMPRRAQYAYLYRRRVTLLRLSGSSLLLGRQTRTGRFIGAVGRLAVERRSAAVQFGRELFGSPHDIGGGIAREG